MNDSATWEQAVAWLVSQADQQDLVVGSYFDAPLEAAALRYWKSPEWETVRRWAPPPPGEALDVGAGNGIASFALARDGWTVTALEPDSSDTVGAGAIKSLMESAHLPLTLIREFAEAIPVSNESMNLVVARQVLHHARDLPQFCRELFRVLKPGGTLIALRDHVISRQEDLPRFLVKHPLHAMYGGENAYTLRAYREALAGAGFSVTRVIRPFDSVVNYAPYNRNDLRRILIAKFRPSFATSWWSWMLRSEKVLDVVLAGLSRVDRTPGRLCSFVCHRPPRKEIV